MCSCTPVLVIRSKQKKIETKMFRKPKQREKSNFVVWKKRKKLENESPSRLFLGHRNWNQITVECELNWVFLDAWLRLGIQKWLPITPPPPPTVFPFQHHTHTHTHTHTHQLLDNVSTNVRMQESRESESGRRGPSRSQIKKGKNEQLLKWEAPETKSPKRVCRAMKAPVAWSERKGKRKLMGRAGGSWFNQCTKKLI